jgi:hypothetical protein
MCLSLHFHGRLSRTSQLVCNVLTGAEIICIGQVWRTVCFVSVHTVPVPAIRLSARQRPNFTGSVGIAVTLDWKDSYSDWRTAVEFTLSALDLWQDAIGLVERSSDDEAEDAKVGWRKIDQKAKAALLFDNDASRTTTIQGQRDEVRTSNDCRRRLLL